MAFLASVVQATLISFHSVSGNWAIAILLLALTLKLILFPTQLFNFRQQKKLLRIQPELEALTEKHRGDPMKLYRESSNLRNRSGVRAAWTLATSVAQIPIFFSVYRVFSMAPTILVGGFAWLPSLAGPDPIYILPLVVALAGYGQQWLFAPAGTKPEMARVMRFMPLVSLAVMVSMPSGLVLYYAVTGFLNLLGEYAVRRFS